MIGASRAKGFTLLEVLVAVAILGLGIASVLELIGTSARTAARTQVVTGALFAAEGLMEELAALDEQELRARARGSGDYAEHLARTAGGPGRWSPEAGAAAGGPRYSYAIEVTPEPEQAGLYRLDVVVEWPDPGSGRVEFTTLRRFPSPVVSDELLP